MACADWSRASRGVRACGSRPVCGSGVGVGWANGPYIEGERWEETGWPFPHTHHQPTDVVVFSGLTCLRSGGRGPKRMQPGREGTHGCDQDGRSSKGLELWLGSNPKSIPPPRCETLDERKDSAANGSLSDTPNRDEGRSGRCVPVASRILLRQMYDSIRSSRSRSVRLADSAHLSQRMRAEGSRRSVRWFVPSCGSGASERTDDTKAWQRRFRCIRNLPSIHTSCSFMP